MLLPQQVVARHGDCGTLNSYLTPVRVRTACSEEITENCEETTTPRAELSPAAAPFLETCTSEYH